jgi:xanthine dehydrogenase accessory factor
MEAARALADGRPWYDEAAGTFCDPLLPEEKLLILGGGHVAKALAGMAPALGFTVTVVDDRPEFIRQDRFPEGVRALQSAFEPAVAEFPFDAATCAVIMTRGHLLDLACVRAVLKRPYRYAGFMGSARKTRLILEQLEKDGCDPARVAALWAPIGLDIGAETPAELAVAILAELVAVRRNAGILTDLRRALPGRRA